MANPRRRRDRRPMAVAAFAASLLALVLVIGSGALGLVGTGPAGRTPGAKEPGPAAALASPAAGSTEPGGAPSPGSASPSIAPSAVASSDPSPASDEPAEATPEDAAVVGQTADVPIVPVTQFRTPVDSVTLAETKATLAGTSKRFKALVLVESEADAILARLGLERPASGSGRLQLATDAEALAADLAAHRDRLAFLRADAVGPSVRALAWGADALFGVNAVKTLADWPLTARLPSSASEAPFDPGASWTLVAGGDILLDRGVHVATRVEKRGVDFPFSGGYADITSRYCCSSFGWKLPKAKRAGGAGTVSELLQGADLAIANFENPAPDKWAFHQHGTVFSAEPAKIEGLADAGLDWVSLANNHIRDAGGNGITQTRKNLAKWGIAFGGAGKDLAEARKPSLLKAGDVTVAILAYDTIAKYYAATADRAGSAQMSAKVVRDDVKAARAAGADVVIVFPHWGVEYQASATKTQRSLGKAAIDAGADLVIGNHPHWAGAMEVYKGKPIWYALGNFVFDQTWSEPTMEGMTLELTFEGGELVQAWMHPHLILDRAQPNLLDPAGDGKVVMDQVFKASKALLPW